MAIKISNQMVADLSIETESEQIVDELGEEVSADDLLETILTAYLLYVENASDEQVHSLASSLGLSKEVVEQRIYKLTRDMLAEEMSEGEINPIATANVEDFLTDEEDLVPDDANPISLSESEDEPTIEVDDDITDELDDPEMQHLGMSASISTDDEFDGLPDPEIEETQRNIIEQSK